MSKQCLNPRFKEEILNTIKGVIKCYERELERVEGLEATLAKASLNKAKEVKRLVKKIPSC